MTMKTRSSANYSNHISATTVPISTTTNRTAVSMTDNFTSSSNSNNIATAGAMVNVDTIMAAKNEANQKFLRSYQAHLQKKFVVRQMKEG
jgi:hypothetical protein